MLKGNKNMYKIAGLYVDYKPQYPRLSRQSEIYKCEDNVKANITIHFPQGFLEERQAQNPHLSIDECEYIWTGSEFYEVLPEFDAFLLHSSAVVYNNKAFLFSAPSGTGKSTHTQLWLKQFDGAYILNDDKPAIKCEDGKFYVYGTPFSGKTDLNVNARVELGGLCMLQRGKENYIEKIPTDDALFNILNQTCRPVDEGRMDKLLDVLDKLTKSMPIHRLTCNMESEAAMVSYNGMKGMQSE